MPDLHWYPGHMTKAVRQMKEDIRLIDVVIELVDARIPISSRNPDIDSLAANKSRVIVLNKADLADDKATEEWVKHFEEKGLIAVKLNSKSGNGIKQVKDAIAKAAETKMARDRARGILNRPVRAIVGGIPNVGKSTFINSFAGRAVTKTGNKPGVTKGKQWIRLNKQVELLDTPGILWPKFEDRKTAEHLAFIGSIRDEVIEKRELAIKFVNELEERYEGLLAKYYGFEAMDKKENKIEFSMQILSLIAEKRALVKKGGEVDTDKASVLILDDFKNGRLGKITLENVGV
ncbi:MAG: ribosome biogenesis GTPase YlqF [Catonella sp.]